MKFFASCIMALMLSLQLSAKPFIAIKQQGILSDSLPLDPAVRHGVLPNGLQYYIYKCNRPEKSIRMQLIVNAGTGDEDDDQTNMPHLIEHLGFRSTTHFPMGLKNFFLSKGVTELNASTALSTNYYINVPLNDSSLLDNGLLALRDWAGGILFLPNEVEEERSAIYREASMANEPGFLAQEKLPHILSGVNSAYRSRVLRDLENSKTSSKESLMRFYKDWYHPMYQAVIIEGAVDESSIELKIMRIFSTLTNEGARKKKHTNNHRPSKLSAKNRLIILSKGKQPSKIEIKVIKRQRTLTVKEGMDAIADYRTEIIEDLFFEMTKNRQNKPNFLYFISRLRIPQRTVIEAQISVREPNEIKEVLNELFVSMKSIGEYGFSDAELSLAKSSLTKTIQNHKTDVSTRLANYFLTRKPFPANEARLKTDILKTITVKEINSLVQPWLLTKHYIDIIFTSPEDKVRKLPEASEVFGWLEEVGKTKVQPFAKPELKKLPTIKSGNYLGGNVITELHEIDATQIILPNGLRVILKQFPDSSMKDGKIEMHGLKVNVGQLIDTRLNSLFQSIDSFVGIDSMSVTDLRLWRNENFHNTDYVELYLNSHEAGIKAKGEAEKVFQLINLYMTRASADKEGFVGYQTLRLKRAMSFTSNVQDFILYQDNDLQKTLTLEEVFEIYKQSFNSIAGFTFIVASSRTKDEMIPLINKYFGSISGSSISVSKDKSISYHLKSELRVDKAKPVIMVGDSLGNVHINVLFQGTCDMTIKNKVILDVLASTLDQILLKRLREKEQAVYSVTCEWRPGAYAEEFFLKVDFQANPADVDRLVAAVQEELHILANGNLWESAFKSAVSYVKSNIEYSMKFPTSIWIDHVANQIRQKNMLSNEGLNKLENLDDLMIDDISKAAKDFLNRDDYKLFKLL